MSDDLQHHNIIPISSRKDPRLALYFNMKEQQLAAHFGAMGISGDPAAPYGRFYAEGLVVLHHLVSSSFQVESILTSPNKIEGITNYLTQLPTTTPIYTIEQSNLEALVGFSLHRGVLAIGKRKPIPTLTEFLDSIATRDPSSPTSSPRIAGNLLILEDLANHDNVGACFRNAAAFGCAGVLLSPRCADPLYRKSLRVSVGCALKLPYTIIENWPKDLQILQKLGIRIDALTPSGDSVITPTSSSHPVALMIGAEGPGLTVSALAAADRRVRIPMAPGVDSLNAATTAAVALYALTANG